MIDLSGWTELEKIPAGQMEGVLVPLGLLPKTADGSISYTPLLTALVLSGALIILLVWRRKKRAK